jgi:hypothetical protein
MLLFYQHYRQIKFLDRSKKKEHFNKGGMNSYNIRPIFEIIEECIGMYPLGDFTGYSKKRSNIITTHTTSYSVKFVMKPHICKFNEVYP